MKKLFNILDLCDTQTRLRLWVVLLFLLWICGGLALYENYQHNLWQDQQITKLIADDRRLEMQIRQTGESCLKRDVLDRSRN